ncbi:6-phospho-beta-glucosidase [Providencia stuartii]|nr:6-phospho-beta-glucosidase [Providencia stuartii]
MVHKLKVVTIGGGSSYTPELIDGFIKRYHELPISELWLVDIEEGKEKLDIIYELGLRMIKNANIPLKLYKTLDRKAALKDADFVTTQLRVGLLKAREKDEVIPLQYGYLGQETNGVGGLFKGLRTIPVIFEILKDIEALCPQAWVINFTNPAGMITEAVYRHTQFRRFIGVCNIPIGLKMFITDVLGLTKKNNLSITLFGLNHMVFIKDIFVDGVSRFDEVLNGIISKAYKASSVKNITGLPFDSGLLKALKLIPCSYLQYYFKYKEMLAIEMAEFYKEGTRAQVVQKIEKELFELYQDPELKIKPKQLELRGGAYYSDAACEVINALYNDKQTEHYVNIPHNGYISNIPANWVVEMTCKLGRNGVTPHERVTQFDEKVLGLIYSIKEFEIAASQAAVSGDFNELLLAMNLNPLVHSDNDARDMAKALLLAHKHYLPNFSKVIKYLEEEGSANKPHLNGIAV